MGTIPEICTERKVLDGISANMHFRLATCDLCQTGACLGRRQLREALLAFACHR